MSETMFPSPEVQSHWGSVFGSNVRAVVNSYVEILEAMKFTPQDQKAVDAFFHVFSAGVSQTMNPNSPINKEWKNYQGDQDEQKTT